MKKIVLLVALYISSLVANGVSYVDLYGEVQVTMVVANKCLEVKSYKANKYLIEK